MDYDYQQPIEKVLEKAYSKNNCLRNRILTIVIALTVCLLFCILSLANGKMEVDTLRNIRTDGMAVSAYIENATGDMGEQLLNLPYVSKTAKVKDAGKLLNGKVKFCDCVVLDKVSFEEMIQPAYTNVTGRYPEEINEIMLSMKTLEYLGIKHPEIGMEISLDFYWNDLFQEKMTGTQKFVLSGYYKDYQNQQADSSIAYISESRMKESGVSWNPCRILIQTEKETISGQEIETDFRRDVKFGEGQRLVCMDSAKYRALTGVFGSYGFAVLFSVLVLLCMFLFIYNVLSISMSNDIRQYGLLGTLGVTNRQIRKIMYLQMGKSGLAGSLIGGLIGSLIVYMAVPVILARMYLGNSSYTEGLTVYSSTYLLVAVILTGLVLLWAVRSVMKRLESLSSIETMKYEEAMFSQNEKKKRCVFRRKRRKFYHRGRPVFYLARANLFRNKKAFLISLISLVLGCEIALCSSMIVRGVDLENMFSENPDVRIGLTQKACSVMMENSQNTSKMQMFPEKVMEDIHEISRNREVIEHKTIGFIPIFKRNKSLDFVSSGEDSLVVIQRIEDDEQAVLEEYIQENNLSVDLKTFNNENGVIILHNNQLSETGMKYADTQVGAVIEAYDLVPVGTDMNGLPTCSMINTGYIDMTDDKFPLRNVCWNGDGKVVLLVTQDTFSALSKILTSQVFEINFDVNNSQEPVVKSDLQKYIRMSNMEAQSESCLRRVNLLYLDCNSDRIAKEQNYMTGSRIILFSISAILLFVGIMNYLNVRITDIVIRKKEMAVLEKVGMTRKQLHTMLTMEGIYFCMIIMGILITVGTGILFYVGSYMKIQIPYFVVEYPWKMFGVLVGVLLVFSIWIPKLVYKKIDSFAE